MDDLLSQSPCGSNRDGPSLGWRFCGLPNNSNALGIATRPREAEELYFHELVAPGAPGNLTPEIHLRLIMPIDALVFALIPLACLLPGDFNRRGQSRRILAATILAFHAGLLTLGVIAGAIKIGSLTPAPVLTRATCSRFSCWDPVARTSGSAPHSSARFVTGCARCPESKAVLLPGVCL